MNTPEKDVTVVKASEEVAIEAVASVDITRVAQIYPLVKPDDLIVPRIQSIIVDDFDLSDSSGPAEFKKIYYGVQVSSVNARLEANNFYESLLLEHSNLLDRNNNSHKNLIKQENLGSLGTWYKLRIGPFEDRSEAKRLCSSMRDDGLEGCIVVELE
tara:strand:+ start:66 stop:536 length:471 start_codon:yes stop_codon:yes gene_type:complete